MRIIFKNLEKSEIATEAVEEYLGDLVAKFPMLKNHRIIVTLSVENSPYQGSSDYLGVKVLIHGNYFGNLLLMKKSNSLYQALAGVRKQILKLSNQPEFRIRGLNISGNRLSQKLPAPKHVFMDGC